MKIIFSRKGFDSQYGQVPSPILSDGSLQALPIPSRYGRPLGDIQGQLGPVHRIANDLTNGTITGSTSVHLDPDLYDGSVMRRPGWRPSFGQVGAAQRHLSNQGVGPGDVFLFFGWFRQAEHATGRWSYARGAPNLHVLFGWLQVGQVLRVAESEYPEWLADHPHVQHASRFGAENTIYIAAERLSGTSHCMPTAGIFRQWSSDLQLTARGRTRSVWRLPSWLLKDPERPALSYHLNRARWHGDDDGVLLKTVAKGQEFVIDVGNCTHASKWLRSLVHRHGTAVGESV